MGTILICIFETMIGNRILGYSISRSENEEGESKGGHAPFGTRLCMAKCSVLYPLSVRLRKIAVCESGINSTTDEKSLVSVPVSITEAKLFYSQIEGI